MRLIDADALIRQLETQDYSGAPDMLEDWTPQDMTKAEIADIQNAPTIEAEPIRHGEWILVEAETGIEAFGFKEMTVAGYICSICGSGVGVSEKYFCYCPNCGAKMNVEE